MSNHTIVEGVSVKQEYKEKGSGGNNRAETESTALITAAQMERQMRWEWKTDR